MLDALLPFPEGAIEASLRAMARIHAFGWGGQNQPRSGLTPLAGGFHRVLHTLIVARARRSSDLRNSIDGSHIWEEGEGWSYLRKSEVARMLYDLRCGETISFACLCPEPVLAKHLYINGLSLRVTDDVACLLCLAGPIFRSGCRTRAG
jgi:hypothetical protein